MTCPSYEKHKADFPRRGILKSVFAGMLFWLLRPVANLWAVTTKDNKDRQVASDPSAGISSDSAGSRGSSKQNLGVSSDGMSDVYLIKGGAPEQNMARLLDMLGGIENLIGKEDIVVLKPNAQWWAQGMTNTDSMKAFIEAVLRIPGFQGEVIVAENHQFSDPDSRGWSTQDRNGEFNLNELIEHFQGIGHKNVTKYAWLCAGPNPDPLEGDGTGGKIVEGPWEGDGYVWREDLVYKSTMGRECMMTYPIFTSKFSGVTIDFKEGAWKDGNYTGQPVKFINFSALNYHGPYCGVTASIKNYMGIVDMTCGFQGPSPKGYWNTHFIGLRHLRVPFKKRLPWRVQKVVDQHNWKYFHHTGGVLGMFMRDVRMADLNIITAHWIGYGSRTIRELSGHTKALLASTDPVALDYMAAQKVLLPLTQENSKRPYLLRMNDASDKTGPYYKFLEACNRKGIGNIDPKYFRHHKSNMTHA